MEKPKLLCISTINWDFLWQRHQTFMQGFANDGWEIDFVENSFFRNPKWNDAFRLINRFRKSDNTERNELPAGITLVSPKVLPPNGILFRMLNRKIYVPRLLRKLRGHYDLIIIYMPSYTTTLLLENINADWILFDCVANFEGDPHASKDFLRIESKILERSDMVVTDSTFLYDKLNQKHHRVFQIHHGVQTNYFQSTYSAPLESYRSVCFFGGIDDRIDWEAVKALVDSGYDVTMIGPVKVRIPVEVTVKPPMTLKKLSLELTQYDVFIIPYRLTDYTDGIIPAKIYECLATGKPLLSSALPSIRELDDLLYICHKPDDYVAYMSKLAEMESKEAIQKRKQYASAQSSSHNFRKLKCLIETERGNHEEKNVTCN